MKKRLDKISGERFVFKQDDLHEDSPAIKLNFEIINHEIVGNKDEIQNLAIDMEEVKIETTNFIGQGAKHASISYQQPASSLQSMNQSKENRKKKFSIHRNTNSIIGYDKEEGVIIETCQRKTKESSININDDITGGKSLPNDANKELNGSVINKSNDQLNVSNLENSFVISESEIEMTSKPLTEGQQIIVSNSILNGSNTSFIPIKNNLNFINLQKTSNVTDSYLMALGGGKPSPEQTSIEVKINLVDEIIEEEESFQESEVQTPCRFNSGLRYGSQHQISSLELKKHPISSFMNSHNKEQYSSQPLNLISSFSNPINLNNINSICPETEKVSCFTPVDHSVTANPNYSPNNFNVLVPTLNLDSSPYKLALILSNSESSKDCNEASNFHINSNTLNSNANISSKTNRNLNNSESWNSSKLNQGNPTGQINQKQSQKTLSNKFGHAKIQYGEIISKHTIEASNKESQQESATNNSNYNSNPTTLLPNTGLNKSKLRMKITHSKSDGRQISELLFKSNPSLLTKYKKEYGKASTPIKMNESKDLVFSSKTDKKAKLKYIQNLAIDIDEAHSETKTLCGASTCKRNNNPISSKLLKTYNTIFSTKNSTPKALMSNSKQYQFQSDFFTKENNDNEFRAPGLANSKTQKLITNRKAIDKDDKAIFAYSTKSLKHVKNTSLREDKGQPKNLSKEQNKEFIPAQGRVKDLHSGSSKINHHVKLFEAPHPEDKNSHKAEAKTYYLSYLEKKNRTNHIKTGSQEVQSKINYQPETEKSIVFIDLHKYDFPSSTTISDTNTTSINESKNNGSNQVSNVAFIDSQGKNQNQNQPSTCKSLISKGTFINDFKCAINKRNSFMPSNKAMSPGFKYKNSFASKNELDTPQGLINVKCSAAPTRKSTIITIAIPNNPGSAESKYAKCKSSDKNKTGL